MTLSIKAIAILAAIQIALLGGAGILIYHYERAAYTERLAGLDAAAKRDTTIRRLVGDSAVSRRQVEQLTVTLDRRTHERDERGTALADLRAVFDTIHVSRLDTAQSVPDGLRLTSQVDSVGVHVRADVQLTLVPAPARALWVWDVRRDALALVVDFSCRGDTALAHVTGPAWATIGIA